MQLWRNAGDFEHRRLNAKRRSNGAETLKGMKATLSSLVLVLCVLGLGEVNPVAGEVPATGSPGPTVTGRTLFLKNCAHCHADDATGDEGPDLHGLHKSDDWIGKRIRNGVKGEMTAFGGKFSDEDVKALIAYLRTLKETP